MLPRSQWSRRFFLGASVAAIGGAATYVFWKRSDTRPERKDEAAFRELLRQTVAGLDMPCNAGEIFLSTIVGGEQGYDVQELVTSLEDVLGRLRVRSTLSPKSWSGLDDDGLIGLLSESIKEDFSNNELCILGGWQLSRTECRLAALKYLWEREEQTGQVEVASTVPACRKELHRLLASPPELSKIVPTQTFVGVSFSVQPNGKSAISVHGSGFNPGAKILFGDTVLRTTFGNSGWMTALVPDTLISQEGTVDIAVRNPDGKTSNAMTFAVVSKEPLHSLASPPELSKIVPTQTFVGVSFSVQPNGKSAISVHGSGFNPGAKILFGDTVLRTTFGNSGWMTALVPDTLISQEGTVDIAVRNPDGKTSNAMTFAVVSKE